LAKGRINSLPIRHFQVGSVVISVIALIAIAALDHAYLWMHWGEVGQFDSYYWGMQDFRDVVYYPCRAVWEGVNPYDPAAYREHFAGKIGSIFPLYSPLIVLLHFPLALLPYDLAGWIYQFVSLVVLLVVSTVALHWTGWRVGVTGVCTLAALILLSEPGRTNLNFGQVTWPLVLASYVALAFAKGRPVWSSVALAIASFKPTYLVTLGLFMLCRGDFRALAYGAIWTCAVTAAALGLMAVCGVEVWEIPRAAIANQAEVMMDPSVEPESSLARVDVTVVLVRGLGLANNSWAVYAAPMAILFVTGWLTWRMSNAEEAFTPDSFATFLICVGSVFGVYHYVYDLVLLTLPAVALFTGAHPSWKRLPKWGIRLLQACLLLLAINVFWTGPAVRVGKELIELFPDELGPWSGICWQFATLLNPVALAALWTAAVVLACRSCSGITRAPEAAA
jgi:hypothetical protein